MKNDKLYAEIASLVKKFRAEKRASKNAQQKERAMPPFRYAKKISPRSPPPPRKADMKVFDKPVKIGNRVLIIDAKSGRDIGYLDADKVFDVVNNDNRYSTYLSHKNGELMLTYNSDSKKDMAIVNVEDDFARFVDAILLNIDTALGADDPINLRLGFSYIWRNQNYITYINLQRFKDAVPVLDKGIVKAVSGTGKHDGVCPTERLIEYLKKSRKLKSDADVERMLEKVVEDSK